MIAYKHVKDNQLSGTLAIEIPKLPVLVNLLNSFNTKLDVQLGITLLHPKDNFCKSIGREKAKKNMTKVILELDYIKIIDKRKLYAFTFNYVAPKDITIYGELQFSEIDASANIHVENVFITEYSI